MHDPEILTLDEPTLGLDVEASRLLEETVINLTIAWVVLLLTLAGVWGVGYLVAGLALIHKAVSSVTSLVANLAFLISGAMIPLDSLGMLYTVLKLLFPMTWGIELLRDVVLNGTTLVELVQSGQLIGLTLQTAVFLLIGLVVFNYSLQRVKLAGELGVY